MTSDFDRTNCSEEPRAPTNERENDVALLAPKHTRRVSWSVEEAFEISSSDGDTTTYYHRSSCNPIDEACQQSPETFERATTSPKKLSLRSKPVSESSSPIKAKASIEMNRDEDREGPRNAPDNSIQNTAQRDGCARSMDHPEKNLPLPVSLSSSSKAAPVDVVVIPKETIEESPEVVHEVLLRRASRLEEVIRSMQKLDSVRQGRSLVKEFELRSRLEGLCEDVLFLKSKKDQLGASLLDLHVRNVDLVHRGEKHVTAKTGAGASKSQRKAGLSERGINDDDDDKSSVRSARNFPGVSDASVQTDDWLFTESGARSGPPETRRATSLRSIE